jgi:hypothetical protein
MAANEKRVTVSVEELALSNSVTLAAIVELLEEKGVISRAEVLERLKVIRISGEKWTI